MGNPPRCTGAPRRLDLMKQETEQDGATAQVSKPLCAVVLKETFGSKFSANKSQYPLAFNYKKQGGNSASLHNQLRTCTVMWCSGCTHPGVVGQSFHQLTVYNPEFGIFTALLIAGS